MYVQPPSPPSTNFLFPVISLPSIPSRQADLNAPDSRGLRPIHLAAMAGMADCVIALVNAGVPVDAMGAEGNTALHLAVFHKKEGVVAVLMRAGESGSSFRRSARGTGFGVAFL